MRAPILITVYVYLSAAAACASSGALPLAAPLQARERLLVQREFRLGTFDFGKTAADPRELSKSIPAMLLTELHGGGHFAIYEGGNIRSTTSAGGPLNEASASQYVDGYLSGTLTGVDDQQACFDLRLSNAVTQEVLYARAVCVGLEAGGRIERGSITRVAEELARAIKQVGNGKVTSSDGHIVFCNKGGQAGVSRGMVAYIVATGDSINDSTIHQDVQRYTGIDPARLTTIATPVIIGEMYIVSVEENYSVGLLYRGNYTLPGDTVFFK
jgi:hypothetical protein